MPPALHQLPVVNYESTVAGLRGNEVKFLPVEALYVFWVVEGSPQEKRKSRDLMDCWPVGLRPALERCSLKVDWVCEGLVSRILPRYVRQDVDQDIQRVDPFVP
ncbi:hypothetical protein HOK021_38840 [Streptomyces hygroscopicus]|nr:hypothetical protein HOK021_38840 [Streptomyces hygroscopicus]